MLLQEFDRTLFPKIQSFYRKLELLKQDLEKTYPKLLLDKAHYWYLQKEAKKEQKILFPTEEAIKFYQTFCTKKKLEEVILDFRKHQLIESLPTLGLKEGCLEKAQLYLTQLRHCQMKKNMGPGGIMKCLRGRGFLQLDESRLPKKKRVLFK